jgi:small-conductance mechanosensitive channel
MTQSIEPAVHAVGGYIADFVAVLPAIAVAAVVLVAFVLVGIATKRIIIAVFRRQERGDLGVLLGGFIKWAVILFGILVFATIVFPSIKPADLLSTLGIGSVAIGFAFKDVLQNWLSGLLILYRRPFRPGDQIVSGEFEGTVDRIEARATMIRTYDSQLVVIPNSDIYTRAVTVRTAFAKRRSELGVGIGYSDDLDRACEIICDALQTVDGVEREPAPEAFPWALGGSSVEIKVRWWSGPRRLTVVRTRGRVVWAIKNALTEAGIDIPYPTRVVFLENTTTGGKRRPRVRDRRRNGAKTPAPPP